MKLVVIATTAALLVTGGLAAQNKNYLNRTKVFSATWAGYVTGGSTSNGGAALDTLDAGEITDFGIDGTQPTMQLVTGMRFVLQDQNSTTSQQFALIAFTEDMTNPGNPDTTGPTFQIGPLNSPTGTVAGPAAWIFTATFNTPAAVPREQSLYFGLLLPPALSASDILLNQFIDDNTTSAAGYSQPGQAYAVNYPAPTSSHRLGIDVTTIAVAFGTRPASCYYDLEVEGPGGHAMTMSNETANPAVSGTASAVTTPHTALYPDAVNFNTTSPARADSAGYIYQDNAFVVGDLVGFMAAFGFNPFNASANAGPMPISSFLGGSTGNACLDLTVNANVGLFLAPTSTGTGTPTPQYFQVTLPIPPASVFTGLKLVIQGFTLATTSGTVRGGPCSAQHF